MQTSREILRLAIAISILCTLLPASWGQIGKSDRKEAAKEAGVDLPNFGKINDNYYRGAQPKATQYDELAGIGVKTIVDLREDSEAYAKGAAEAAGLRYINLPLDDKQYPPPDAADRFLKIVDNKVYWPVYVHCAGGRHRTGAMTAVYRISQDGWDLKRAYAEMKEYDFYTWDGHKPYKQFIEDYARNHKSEEAKE
jgi:protein tyrosine/serine phosphatase